jgi:hypothetical protein
MAQEQLNKTPIPMYLLTRYVAGMKIEKIDILTHLPEYPAGKYRYPAVLYFEDGNAVRVSSDWIGFHLPEVGKYYVIDEEGESTCMSAATFESQYQRMENPSRLGWQYCFNGDKQEITKEKLEKENG